MRKIALLMTVWFCILMCAVSILLTKSADTYPETDSRTVFVLPASLREIGEAAFEGTSAEFVVIPSTTIKIEDRAFADNKALRVIHIPDSVKFIGEHAFAGSLNVKIQGTLNSYADAWAQTHDVAFLQEITVVSGLVKRVRQMWGILFYLLNTVCILPKVQFRQRRRTENQSRSMRPQDRRELYPINYRFP